MRAALPVPHAKLASDRDGAAAAVDPTTAPIVVKAHPTEPQRCAATHGTLPSSHPGANDIVDSILSYRFPATPEAYEILRTGAVLQPVAEPATFTIPINEHELANPAADSPQESSHESSPASPHDGPAWHWADVREYMPHMPHIPHLPHLPQLHLPEFHLPRMPWSSICSTLELAGGSGLKTLGAIFTIRQFASVVTYITMLYINDLLDGSDPAADNRNALFLSAPFFLAHVVISHKYAGRAFSSMLTFKAKDEDGDEYIHRVGGEHHDKITAALGQLPTVFTLGLALTNGWNLTGTEFNKVMLTSLVAAANKTHIYCLGRGVLEKFGARLMPDIVFVGKEGRELGADSVEKLAGKTAMFMAPFVIVNAGFVVEALLNFKWADALTIHAGDGAPMTSPTVDMHVGLYEWTLYPIIMFSMWAAARTEGGSIALRSKLRRTDAADEIPPPPDEPPPPLEDAIPGPPPEEELDAEVVRIHITPEVTQQVADAANSLQNRKFMSWWRWLVSSPAAPHVYSSVGGFRILMNDCLNWTLCDPAIAALNASSMPFGIAGFHAILMGPFELVPGLRLIPGISAQATEGSANRLLFDKLLHLFKCQDLLHVARFNTPPTHWEVPILRRTLDPEILGFVKGNEAFDDVREHVERLANANRPRRAEQNPHTATLLSEGQYPPAAMTRKFGRYIARSKFLPNSPFTSGIMALAKKLHEEAEEGLRRYNEAVSQGRAEPQTATQVGDDDEIPPPPTRSPTMDEGVARPSSRS